MAGSHETVVLVQRQDYQFAMQFGGNAPDGLADEPPLQRLQGAAVHRRLRSRRGRIRQETVQLQILQRLTRPNYFCHFAIIFFASS